MVQVGTMDTVSLSIMYRCASSQSFHYHPLFLQQVLMLLCIKSYSGNLALLQSLHLVAFLLTAT